MGYNLKIGEAITVFSDDDEIDEDGDIGLYSIPFFDVEIQRNDDAPAFGEPTDYENQRWPSYISWSDFCDVCNLGDLFYYENGHFRGGHPGCFSITKVFTEVLNKRFELYKENNPNMVASFDTYSSKDKHLCRFEWLVYWVNKSFKECKHPIFFNS